ncbi:30S ribosomal protein S6 [bacterium]|jgi:small subunit ribosomal protein S6|nr:30S ribosomal protein S6 [bacterium]MBT3581721.1 30S ribosomal protein S6 [bacterium]MBT4551655.1 30S ribosomal protein S6 [bacterium]MBT5989176.1 30S ribosomal protein S6 [bacterium]MBT7088545.1 30S ribosomal protein S6 [bacterium]
MKEYEILYIIKPNLGEDKYTQIIEKIKELINKNEGEEKATKVIGIKEFAQILSKQKQGYYVQTNFNANNKTLEKLHAFLKIDENIFRHLIITMDSITPKNKKVKTEA